MYLKCGTIILSSLFIPVILSENCITPNNEVGDCISLYRCLSLLETLKKQTSESIEFVRSSNCGGTAVDPKVCCRSSGCLKAPVKKQEDSLLADRRYCGYQHADDYTNKNEEINIDEFPWIAIVERANYDDNSSSLCGGFLINTRYVLTTVSCVISPYDIVTGVRLGDFHLKNISDCATSGGYIVCSTAEIFGIEKTIVHPDYNPKTSANDIALIRLNKYVLYSDFIRPICLPMPGGVAAKSGNIVTKPGFGQIGLGKEAEQIKAKVLAKVVTQEECVEKYRHSRKPVTDNHICSIDLNTSQEFSCIGDTGMPVMFSYRNQWQADGIFSYGICSLGEPDVHVKVVNYIDWIKKNIKP